MFHLEQFINLAYLLTALLAGAVTTVAWAVCTFTCADLVVHGPVQTPSPDASHDFCIAHGPS